MCSLFGLAFLTTGVAVPFGIAALSDDELLELSQDASAIAAGKETYQTVCFSCHGQNLEGGTGFSLRDGEWIHGGSPSQISTSIAKGFPEKGMVAFETVYDATVIDQVVAYILSKQIGLRKLRYQIFHSAPTNVGLERLIQSKPTKTGVLPNNYSDVTLAEVDDFAMVFEGTLLVPNEGKHFLRIGKGRGDDIKVEVDGVESKAIDRGNRDYEFPVKHGEQQVRLSYLKKDKVPRFEVFLRGESVYEPLSLSARDRLLRTNFFVKASERPIVIRKKVEHLPPKSISVGYPGSMNYAFSPVTNSIVGIWRGEFLNIGPNIDGRGKGASRILGEWLFHDSPGIQLLMEGEPLKGSFIKYTVGDSPRFEYADHKRRVRILARPIGPKSIRFTYALEGFGRKRITLRLPEGLPLETEDGAVLAGRLIVDKDKRRQFNITIRH